MFFGYTVYGNIRNAIVGCYIYDVGYVYTRQRKFEFAEPLKKYKKNNAARSTTEE